MSKGMNQKREQKHTDERRTVEQEKRGAGQPVITRMSTGLARASNSRQ